MGYIRIFLAISVVFAHSDPFFKIVFLNGNTAVEIFFMISGFYMAFVLNEVYTPASGSSYIRKFYC